MKRLMMGITGLLIAGMIVSGCDETSPNTSAAAAVDADSAVQSPKPEPTPSNWEVSTTKDDVTGAATTTAVDGIRNDAIVVRKRGTHLELYIDTPDFLETTENIETRESRVAYKFDDGPVIRQNWAISDDNTALFYPGNPINFLEKLARAKSLAFRYQPSETIPKSETFDVSGFPGGIIATSSSPKQSRKR